MSRKPKRAKGVTGKGRPRPGTPLKSAVPPSALEAAVGLHRAGRMREAEQAYRRILAVDPRHADALHLLGVLALQAGQHEAAVDLIGRAVAVLPDFVEALSNLGLALKETGALDGAADVLQRAIALRPDYADAHNNLGNVRAAQGRLEDAVEAYRAAIRARPDSPRAENNLGVALIDLDRADEAITCFEALLARHAGFAEARTNLGTARKAAGDLAGAVADHRAAIAIRPDYVPAHYNLGIALQAVGDIEAAEAAYREAIARAPNHADAHNNLGGLFLEVGRLDEATDCFRAAIAADPAHAEAHSNLGLAVQKAGRLTDAMAEFRRTLEIAPDSAKTYTRLGIALNDAADFDGADAALERSLELNPDLASLSRRIFCRQYRPGVTAASLLDLHREWQRAYGDGGQAACRPAGQPRGKRPLRLGFHSADLGVHPVGRFVAPLFDHHDPSVIEIFAYCDRHPDDVTRRLQAAADGWLDCRSMTDQALAERISDDGIDILFDLHGHTGRNRLKMFARRAAPLQATWAGYVGTTGLDAMDLLIADRFEVPPGADEYYCEKVVRLPNDYICFDAPDDAPPVGELPARANGFVTFGSFNATPKMNDGILDLWARVLASVPNSRLLLKYRWLDDPILQTRVSERMSRAGVDLDRVVLEGPSPHAALMARYNDVDIGLDTMPYSGGLTTCEALWMGVPVITVPGATFAGRHSLSHLSNAGLTETIADDPDGFVATAQAMAADIDHLAELRAGLREQMIASPLCDGPRFARDFAAAMIEAWETAGS